MKHTLNFAHRGYSAQYPENTLLAFQKAMETGCDGISLEVQLSRDGEVVVFCDETLERRTDGTGAVAGWSLFELKKLRAGRDKAGRVCRIPTLREYFELVKDTEMQTEIELKTESNPYPGIEEKVLALVEAFSQEKKVIVTSRNHYSVQRMKALAPALCCGLRTESWLVNLADYARHLGAVWAAPNCHSLQPECVEELHRAGIRVSAGPVSDPAVMALLLERGADMLVSADPVLTGEVIERFEEAAWRESMGK